MKIEILGTGCAKCISQLEITKQAIAQIGGFHSIEKIEDIMKIMEHEVVSTPAIVVDGVVKSSGKLLNIDEVIELLVG